jgi:hypothetical protein
MFARLSTYENVDLRLADQARLVGIGFYATAAEAALNAVPDTLMAEVPEEGRAALEWQPESVGLYEVVEHELRDHA